MNQKELKELIEFLIEKDIAEFELERGDVKVKIKRAGEHTVVYAHGEMPRPAGGTIAESRETPGAVAPAAPPSAPEPEEDLHIVKSPIVGTLLRSAVAGRSAFRQSRGHGGGGTGAVHR